MALVLNEYAGLSYAQVTGVLARHGFVNTVNGVQRGMPPGVTYSWSQPRPDGSAMVVRFQTDGDRITYSNRYEVEGDYWWQPVAAALLPIIVLPAIGGPMAGKIGEAILGPTLTAAYPSAAVTVGNVAMNTITNGGDVGEAVKSTLIGEVGQAVNLGALAATDSRAIGSAAQAATTAALRGGDIQTAVASSLLQTGVKNMSDFYDFFSSADPVDTTVADYTFGGEIVAGFADPIGDVSDFYTGIDTTNSLDVSMGGGVGFNFGGFEDAFIASENYSDADFNYSGDVREYDYPEAVMAPVDFNIFTETPNLPPLNPTEQAGSSGGSEWVVDLTNLALAAIRVNQAYQASQQAPRTVTQGAGGVTTTGNRNGTVTVRNPATGAVQVTRPGVGIPYVLSDGSTIINNGNGTYSTIKRDGTSTTTAYTAASSGSASGDSQWIDGVPNAALLAGGAVLAFLALKGR